VAKTTRLTLHSPDETTKRVVFWSIHTTNLVVFLSILLCDWYLKNENSFDLFMAEVFLLGVLFTFLGAKAGGILGAAMEEDVCSQLDMGVLSSMGSLIGAIIFGFLGTSLTGLYLYVPSIYIHVPLGFMLIFLFIFHYRNTITVHRMNKIDCCGRRTDNLGKPLVNQPMKMKNKLAILLNLTLLIGVVLTVIMVIVMKRDLANKLMLGGMMYGMGGAMFGGMLGGWLAGLLDKHTGEPEHDNPIMVCGMALMGGMMGGMAAGMIGGMMGLMGAFTIVPTVILSLGLLLLCYFWIIRPEFQFEITPRTSRDFQSNLNELLEQES